MGSDAIADYQVKWESFSGLADLAPLAETPNAKSESFADFDGDGNLEVLLLETPYLLHVASAADGSVLFTAENRVVIQVVRIVDIDHDSLPDIVASGVGATVVVGWSGGPVSADPEQSPATSSPVRVTANPVHAGQAGFELRLGSSADVEIDLFDVGGRHVCQLLDSHLSAGAHQISWDGRDSGHRRLASGTYLWRMRIDGQPLREGKLVLVD